MAKLMQRDLPWSSLTAAIDASEGEGAAKFAS
jgi:hypothetical protein